MKKRIKKHPLAIRWFHWVNFPLLMIMIWSGFLIYWANDVYAIKVAGKTLIRFFPQSFYEAFNMKYRLGEGMAFHFVFMWFFGSFITGIAIYKPVQFGWVCWLCGGYEWARAEHFILTIGYCLFFIVHLLQVVRAGWNNFQGMVTGFEIKK